jgi:hypothetical protein
MSKPMTSEDLPNATSSPALGDGATPSDSPDGPILDLFGRVVVPVSPSRAPGNKSAGVTIDISGRIGRGSSASVALGQSLASRLKARLPTAGSTLFSMTWSEKITPAGRHLCRLRASARSISDNGCGSWRTPTDDSKRGGAQAAEKRIAGGHTLNEKMDATGRTVDGKKHTASLEHAVKFATWPTPLVNDELGSGYCYGPTKPDGTRARFLKLPGAAALASWATPAARDYRSESATDEYNEARWNHTRGKPLSAEATLSGPTLNGSPVETAKSGQLNPAFSLWLMGYPTAWASCGALVTRLSRRLRRK